MNYNPDLDTILTLTEELINDKLEELESLEKALEKTIERNGPLRRIQRLEKEIASIKEMLKPVEHLLENND